VEDVRGELRWRCDTLREDVRRAHERHGVAGRLNDRLLRVRAERAERTNWRAATGCGFVRTWLQANRGACDRSDELCAKYEEQRETNPATRSLTILPHAGGITL